MMYAGIDWSNPYDVAARTLENRLIRNYLQKPYKFSKQYCGATYDSSHTAEDLKRERKKMGEKRWQKNYLSKVTPEGAENRTRRNRTKRMRDHRQEQQIKKLKHMAEIEVTVRRLVANSKSFTRKELKHLFDSKQEVFHRTYRSRAYDVSQRVDYLIDLLTNYEEKDFADEFNGLFLEFKTSLEHPLKQGEWERLQNYFNQRFPTSANIKYGEGIGEDMDMDIRLELVGCS
jgi:hypothetical protein